MIQIAMNCGNKIKHGRSHSKSQNEKSTFGTINIVSFILSGKLITMQKYA